MISYKHKCIFVHIPKTGGSSLEKIIWPNPDDKTVANLWCNRKDAEKYNKYQKGGLQHLFARNIKKEVGTKIFNSFYTFTIVRNPWDRVISQFTFFNSTKKLQDYLGISPFKELKYFLDYISKNEFIQWEPQYRFIEASNGENLISKIFRFEEFEDSIHQILTEINFTWPKNVNLTIPHLKKSIRKDYQSYYDEESKDIVFNLYKKDIIKFNYEFDI